MPNAPVKIKQLSEEERHNYYKSWESSGLSKAKFCKEQGLPLGTFYYWHKLYGKIESPVEGFSRVSVKERRTEILYENNIEVGIRLPNQTQLQMTLSMQQLIGLIRGATDATPVIR